jgi:CCR4-NOT transcription complex subunit 10
VNSSSDYICINLEFCSRRNNTSIQEQPQRDDGLRNYEDKLHQTALYLKANSEHLKGNAKKALKLCVEAENQNHDSTQPTATTAVHFNNLGILHQSIGKLHIALHYFNKALGVLCQIEHNQRSDFPYEEVNQNSFYLHSTLAILYNVSLCAFQAKQWMASYECMAKCVISSPNLYALRPKCWLQMAEACIGKKHTE